MSWVFSLGHVGSKGGNCQKDDPEKDENEQKPSFQLIGWKKLYFHRLAPLERTIYLYMLILSSIAILAIKKPAYAGLLAAEVFQIQLLAFGCGKCTGFFEFSGSNFR